jgi:hypothetical protein
MSYIVRSGIVTGSTALLGEDDPRYAYLTVASVDLDTTPSPTQFTVQVFGSAAERIVRIIENGHHPQIVFAGRLVIMERGTPDGPIQEWSVGAEHLGISIEDESLIL